MNRNTRAVLTFTATLVVLGAAGIALAAFTADSTVQATGQTAKMKPLDVDNATAHMTYSGGLTKLWPGHTAGVVFTVSNPNEVAATVSGVTLVAVTMGDKKTDKLCLPVLKIHGDDLVKLGTEIATTPVQLGPEQFGADVVPAGGKSTRQVTVNDNVIELMAGAPADCAAATITTTWAVTGSNA